MLASPLFPARADQHVTGTGSVLAHAPSLRRRLPGPFLAAELNEMVAGSVVLAPFPSPPPPLDPLC